MWSEQPDYDEVRGILQALATAKAEMRLAECDLEEAVARIDREKPRTPWARVVGLDEESGRELAGLRRKLVGLKNSIDQYEAELQFYNYHRDMFKALSFSGRA